MKRTRRGASNPLHPGAPIVKRRWSARLTTVMCRIKEVDVDRVEARRLLEHGTGFRFVGDKVLVRNMAMLESHQEPIEEAGAVLARSEQDVVGETPMVMAA